MYQLVRASLLDGSDDTTWHLLFANNTPTDVLLRQDLDQLAAQNPQRFKVGQAPLMGVAYSSGGLAVTGVRL